MFIHVIGYVIGDIANEVSFTTVEKGKLMKFPCYAVLKFILYV